MGGEDTERQRERERERRRERGRERGERGSRVGVARINVKMIINISYLQSSKVTSAPTV